MCSVDAVDLDLGDNGRLNFSVSDPHFAVEVRNDKTAVITTAQYVYYMYNSSKTTF